MEGEVGFKGTVWYRGVQRGTVWEWNSSDESAIKCKRFKRKPSPDVSAFLDLIINLIIPRFDM